MQTSGAPRRENAESRLNYTVSHGEHRRRPGLEPGPITTGSYGAEKSSNSILETMDHAVWVPAQGRDDGM